MIVDLKRKIFWLSLIPKWHVSSSFPSSEKHIAIIVYNFLIRSEMTHTHAYVLYISIHIFMNVWFVSPWLEMSIESSYCSILLFSLHHTMIVKHEIGACKVLFNQENSSDFILYQIFSFDDERVTDGACPSFSRLHSKSYRRRRRNSNWKWFDSIRTPLLDRKTGFRYRPPSNFLVHRPITWSIEYFRRGTSKEQIIYIDIHCFDIYDMRCVGDTVGWAVGIYVYAWRARDRQMLRSIYAWSEVTRVLMMEIDDGLYTELSFDPFNAWSDVHIW